MSNILTKVNTIEYIDMSARRWYNMVKGKDRSTKEGEDNMATITNTTSSSKRPCSPIKSLAESIKEMMMIRKGKAQKRTWRELKKDLNK